MKRILFIAAHRKDRAPGQRFRFEQYFDFLSSHGYSCELSPIITESDDKVFYHKGKFLSKILILVKTFLKRAWQAVFSSQYDIVFIFREAHMTGTTILEKVISKSSAKIVFDFDDAIWNYDVSDANRRFGWLKDPSKTGRIISMSDLVFAGNQYLADYALQWNDNVRIIPTTIDTEEYLPSYKQDNIGRICIGWSGSITTIKYFDYAVPFFRDLKAKYGDKIYFKVIGDGSYVNDELGIKGIPWSKKDELVELGEIDIGVMPMPDDEWSKGKCGLKGLQYMALEIATVMSPVGVNCKIIEEGVNGFLADSKEDWVGKISRLIEDDNLRRSISVNGRKTVEDYYSVNSQKQVYLNEFDKLISNK